jgi:hypothetical protein
MIKNYASVWRVSYDYNLRSFLRLAKAGLNYDHSFIVLATVITIVNYNRKTFIVQASGLYCDTEQQDTQHSGTENVVITTLSKTCFTAMLTIVMLTDNNLSVINTGCYCDECRCAECHCSECRYAACCYAGIFLETCGMAVHFLSH